MTALAIVACIAIAPAVVVARALWTWPERRLRALRHNSVITDTAIIIEAEANRIEAERSVTKLARHLHNAGAIHPLKVRTWDGRVWRIDDGVVTELEDSP